MLDQAAAQEGRLAKGAVDTPPMSQLKGGFQSSNATIQVGATQQTSDDDAGRAAFADQARIASQASVVSKDSTIKERRNKPGRPKGS